ncbi:TraU family protein [Xylophilus sp. ASV27]|uniref:TraU family protein n=1 Tax=Xylophilus sp. ASV27 TaxID=2795129 RepID=UPI0018EDC6C5|nr:TraU family protein [Xylophilus sp. ASV27]
MKRQHAIRRLRRTLCALSAGAFLAASQPAAAITTPGVIAATASAALSCLSYRVQGVCFFLRCKLAACWIETSIKISHYVPDVVISTYNEPLRHPWTDLGTVVATTLNGATSAVFGRLSDSSAGGLDTPSAMANFKGADAIGNPAGMLAQMIAGGTVAVPPSLAIPSVTELMRFPSQELPAIARQWTQVPTEIVNTVASDAKKMLDAPGQLLSGLQTIMKSIEGVRQVIEIADTVSQVSGAVGSFQQIGNIITGATGGAMLICPGGASLFGLHFQSELDAPFWRGVLPLELLYPASWVPGLGEVGSGYTQTWGPTYPRQGEIIQTHPVKASAVLAERVASIIYKPAQPHIYTRVTPNGGGYVYFGSNAYQWQMLHPNVWSGCQTFGANDSLSLTSFGDGQTDSADGYAWNFWKHYVCCQQRGFYLYSFP